MPLILASHVTPIIKELLHRLNPLETKVMVVMNARDYHTPADFAAVTQEKVTEFIDAGFDTVESLDLKDFFNKPAQLAKTLEAYHPDVICAVGGDEFILNTAIKLSGFDIYLKSRLEDKNFFYCGSSAGAIVVVQDLKYYLLTDQSTKLVRDRYHVEPELKGLGLLDDYVIPHLGEPEFAHDVKLMSQNLESAQKNIRYISKNGAIVL